MAVGRQFGSRVRELREKKKATDPTFSLRQFAQRIGVSATFLSKVETGDFAPPSPDTIKKIAVLLGVDADELLALAGKVDPELSKIIQEKPRVMADLLRVAKSQGLSAEDIQKLTDQVRRGKKP
jgi:transcriptional regulator with XRE-family HTH domain